MNLSNEQIQRYSRHILLPEMGGRGQCRLLTSSVLIVFTQEERGSAAVTATYLVAGGVGTIGWCPIGELEGAVPETGTLAGILNLYDSSGLAASAAALNHDARLKVEAKGEEAGDNYNLVVLFGRSEVLKRMTARFERDGKPALRGIRKGWIAAILAGQGGLNAAESFLGTGETFLPAAPVEGLLGAMMASYTLRALLEEGKSVGSTVLARFDLSRGLLKSASR